MIVVVPADTPVTVPPAEPEATTVATGVLLDTHPPPGGVSASSTVAPTHTVPGPVIVPGDKLTVIVVVAVHPVVAVKVMTDVPVTTPHTVPVVATTVATPVLLLAHVPAYPAAVSAIDAPTHTAVGPVIVGAVLTAIMALPVIILVHPVTVLVANTVYVPAADSSPKSIGPPVPGTVVTGVLPLSN